MTLGCRISKCWRIPEFINLILTSLNFYHSLQKGNWLEKLLSPYHLCREWSKYGVNFVGHIPCHFKDNIWLGLNYFSSSDWDMHCKSFIHILSMYLSFVVFGALMSKCHIVFALTLHCSHIFCWFKQIPFLFSNIRWQIKEI